MRGRSPARILIVAALVVGVAQAACSSGGAAAPDAPASDPVSRGTDLGAVATFEGLARTHVEGDVDYPQTPPVGGPHAPVWQDCGFYDAPVPDERAVHSLEHGAVWITYDPALGDEEVAVLEALAAREGYVLVSPREQLPGPVVASAWGAQLVLPAATDPRLETFVRTYAESPRAPEPGAPCSGGTADTGAS